MPNYPGLSHDDYLEALFRRHSRGVKPILELHDAVMREPSELDIATRELIAAFVSGLNACAFCHGAHSLMAQAFGVDAELVERLVSDGPDAAPVAPELRPLLRFVAKLTREPARVTASDAKAVLEAGWSEAALHDAVLTAALYAFMNRILDAAGIAPKPSFSAPTPEDLAARRQGTYLEWGRAAGLLPE